MSKLHDPESNPGYISSSLHHMEIVQFKVELIRMADRKKRADKGKGKGKTRQEDYDDETKAHEQRQDE